MDTEFVMAIDSITKTIAPPLISLASVWIGWRLGVHSQWKQRRVDNLQKRLDALREVMTVASDVPPEISITDLKAKLVAEPEFCRSLSSRLNRLFGLRTELTPYLEPELRRFIDFTFCPLFISGVGSYALRPEKTDGFAYACIELYRLAKTVEEKLISEHEVLVG